MPSQTHYRACNLCEAICGLAIVTEGDRITSVKGDHADPFSRGHICPKAVAYIDIQSDPDRLRGPVKRIGKGADAKWETISWDEAFDLVATRLAAIQRDHGNDAIATYQGNPTVHSYGMLTHSGGLFSLLKSRNRFSASSVDQLPQQLVVYWMYGHQLLVPIPDIDRTGYLLMLGANPVASNGSMMTAPDVANRLKELRARGGKLVVIDPRRTETAAVADEHHFVRPGSDAAFLFALLNTIFTEGLARHDRLAPMLEGMDAVRDAIHDFTPECAAAACGISADAIRRIAREFAAAPHAACYGRLGVSTQRHGTLCQWAIQLLNIATGNLDRSGGALVTRPALDIVATMKPGSYARWHSRVRKFPEVASEYPSAVMAEEMLTLGEGQVRAFVTVAGNPVLSTPNGRQLEAALDGLEFMVSLDFYVNETTRFADVILPSTTSLERDHYDITFNVLAIRNVTRYNAPVLPKPEGALHDWEILERLAAKLAEKLGTEVRPTPPPHAILDSGLKAGPYGSAAPQQLSLQKLKDAPHGIDLGALEPSFPERLMTPDKRIQCAPPRLLEALHEARAALLTTAPATADALLLIGRRHVRSNNSWMHNYYRLVKGKSRSGLWMHPDDMAERGLVDGADCHVTSRIGTVTMEVLGSADMMRGVVSIPHGWGHGRPDTRLRIASNFAGVSANDLTDDAALDAVSGNAALNGEPVSVV